jgi:hypothetical protein
LGTRTLRAAHLWSACLLWIICVVTSGLLSPAISAAPGRLTSANVDTAPLSRRGTRDGRLRAAPRPRLGTLREWGRIATRNVRTSSRCRRGRQMRRKSSSPSTPFGPTQDAQAFSGRRSRSALRAGPRRCSFSCGPRLVPRDLHWESQPHARGGSGKP